MCSQLRAILLPGAPAPRPAAGGSRRLRFAVLGAGGLVFLLAVLTGIGCQAPPAPPKPASTRVTALGRFEPRGGIIRVNVPVGDRLGKLGVKEGEEVHEGDLLALLQSHALREAELALAEGQLREARARYAAVNASFEAQLKEAKVNQQQVEAEAANLNTLQRKVDLLEQQRDQAVKDQQRLQNLQFTSVPDQERERQALAVSKAETDLQEARSQLKKAEKIHELDQKAAAARLETLAAGQRRALQEIPLETAPDNVRVAKERLRASEIRAPSDGRILKILTHEGETIGTHPILWLGDTRQMVAIAEILETDVLNIRKLGHARATITSDALPRPLTGTVQRISPIVARNTVLDVSPAAAVDQRVVEMRVLLDSADREVAATFVNLQVTVEVETSR